MKALAIMLVCWVAVVATGSESVPSTTSSIIPLQSQVILQLQTAVAEGRARDAAYLSMTLTQLQAAEVMEVGLELKREFIKDPKETSELLGALAEGALKQMAEDSSTAEDKFLYTLLYQYFSDDFTAEQAKIVFRTVSQMYDLQVQYSSVLEYLDTMDDLDHDSDWRRQEAAEKIGELHTPSKDEVATMVDTDAGVPFLNEWEKRQAEEFLAAE